MNRLYKELKIKSSLKSLVEVEKFVEEICEIYSINNSYYGNILLAIEEASKNAILHGNSSDIRKNVLITFQNSPGGLCFTIEDEGSGFDYNNVPSPLDADEKEKDKAGKGLFLIRNLADKVLFNPKGNNVEITFYISSINHEKTLNRINQLHQYFHKQKSLA
jgi:serine/threonine-protein kinase RsbW